LLIADKLGTQAVLDLVPDGHIVTSADGAILYANQAVGRMLNRRSATLIAKSVTTLFVKTEGKAVLTALAKLGAANPTQEQELHLKRGRDAPLVANVRLVLAAETTGPPLVHWLVRDLTAIRQADKSRERSEFLAYAGRLLSASPDLDVRVERVTRLAVPAFADLCIIHVCDAQGQVLRVRVAHADPVKEAELAAIERQYRLNANLCAPGVGGNPTDKRRFFARVSDDLLRDIAYAEEHVQVLRQLGLKSFISVPLKTHSRSFGAVAFATLGSGRVYEAEDLQLAESLARRAALAIENAIRYEEAQEAIAAGQSALQIALEELRLPLNVISNMTQVVKTQLLSTPLPLGSNGKGQVLSANLEEITRAGERALGMVNDLARLTTVQKETFKLHRAWMNLSELVYALVENLRLQQQDGRFPRDVQIRLLVPESPQISIQADEARLAEVVTNLLDNALKYSPRGGVVEVSLALEENDEAPYAPYAHLVVRDQGIGVPPAEQARIFQPFVRATNTRDRNIAGMGIGLALCYEIIQRHQGRIWVESQGDNSGSAFHIILPQAEVDID
jgi:PAS domain S-box-containing protein